MFIYCTISEYFKPQLIERHLTISIQFIILVLRNPASPAAVKKRRQRLKMSQEKKDALREKDRLSKNAKRQVETNEESAQRRRINCECMMRKCLFETQEESALRKKTMRDCVAKQRKTESEEQGAKRKKTDCELKRKKRKDMRHQSESNREDMTNVIDRATKEAKQFLHRTRDPGNPHRHRATVCIICDRFIIGTETIHKLTKEDIGAHSERLGVKSYEEFYHTTLKPEVKRQYQVQGLQNMLLSLRSRKYPDGYATCSVCYTGMQPQMASKKTPPKFAIANGFVIGCFPRVVKFFNKQGQKVTRKVENDNSQTY